MGFIYVKEKTMERARHAVIQRLLCFIDPSLWCLQPTQTRLGEATLLLKHVIAFQHAEIQSIFFQPLNAVS